MLPGGLQAVPPVHVRLSCVRTSHSVGPGLSPTLSQKTWYVLSSAGFVSFVPPQQAEVRSQKLPVMRQPPDGWQTFVPVPRSTHLRVQQFESFSQGMPSCVQSPDASRQRPTPPAAAVQRPEQQSFGPLQMSPGALQEDAGAHQP
jgi:hypothetical protein